MLKVYLAGEIHTNWRDEIIDLCDKEKLDIEFTSPVTDHEASDNCGVDILGEEAADKESFEEQFGISDVAGDDDFGDMEAEQDY